MIRSCEDVKTMTEFNEFSRHSHRILSMGLSETAVMMRWSHHCLIRPDLFHNLVEKNRRIKK
ncbi:hypothetical protein LCGC14_1445670 [marine sediment metagenome]|uniref:Uncharacterized protein n=1 Tax=marine sediment metagenome TaxID=412755 RepID=A0A0F9K5L1_9ZZZZ